MPLSTLSISILFLLIKYFTPNICTHLFTNINGISFSDLQDRSGCKQHPRDGYQQSCRWPSKRRSLPKRSHSQKTATVERPLGGFTEAESEQRADPRSGRKVNAVCSFSPFVQCCCLVSPQACKLIIQFN